MACWYVSPFAVYFAVEPLSEKLFLTSFAGVGYADVDMLLIAFAWFCGQDYATGI